MDNHNNTVLQPKAPSSNDREDAIPASSFVQVQVLKARDGTDCLPGKDGGIYPKIDCRNCGKYGHFASNCPLPKKKKGGKNKKPKKTEESDDEASEEEEDEKDLDPIQNHPL